MPEIVLFENPNLETPIITDQNYSELFARIIRHVLEFFPRFSWNNIEIRQIEVLRCQNMSPLNARIYFSGASDEDVKYMNAAIKMALNLSAFIPPNTDLSVWTYPSEKAVFVHWTTNSLE